MANASDEASLIKEREEKRKEREREKRKKDKETQEWLKKMHMERLERALEKFVTHQK